MGDSSVEVTDENREAAQEAKGKAMEALSEGNFDEAIEHLTRAITLNPTSAIMYGNRGQYKLILFILTSIRWVSLPKCLHLCFS